MRDELIRRLAARIAPDDIDATAAVLDRSPDLAGDLSWLREIFEVADALPMPEVPASLSASLHAIMPGSDAVRREVSTTIHDSRTAGELVGARGGTDTDGWTVMYTALSADIVLDGEPTAGDSTAVRGQVLSRVEDPGPFTVRVSGQRDASTRSDELGQFDLGVLPTGVYEFDARCSTFAVSWSTTIGRS